MYLYFILLQIHCKLISVTLHISKFYFIYLYSKSYIYLYSKSLNLTLLILISFQILIMFSIAAGLIALRAIKSNSFDS